jgi:phosphoribosylamine--glycine ligase
MKILVIGSGGREHAISWALAKSSKPDLKLYCAPGNGGIAQVADCVPIDTLDIDALARFAEEKAIDLTVVGGEAPLAAGIVDLFESRGLAISGASMAAARLESSKAFAKQFMSRHEIPTAKFRVATEVNEAIGILRSGEFGSEADSVVIKADGLAAGKGVIVASSHAEAEAAIKSLMIDGAAGVEAASRIVIEETLEGPEASLLLFADGKDYVLMPPARDHKRVGENDTGPNTGGMGVVTDSRVLDEEIHRQAVRDIVEPTLEGARKDGFEFRGVLFVGIMLTKDGPRVLEYNVRLGDPEAQAILIRLQSDLSDIFEATTNGTLGQTNVHWISGASACVVLAARGYPGPPQIGSRIEGLDRVRTRPQVEVFHAGTKRSDDGEWITAGGRVLGVTAVADNLDSALDRAYSAVDDITWDGMHFRRDIGRS